MRVRDPRRADIIEKLALFYSTPCQHAGGEYQFSHAAVRALLRCTEPRGGAAVAWPFGARAQQADRMRRVGVLVTLSAEDSEARARVAAHPTYVACPRRRGDRIEAASVRRIAAPAHGSLWHMADDLADAAFPPAIGRYNGRTAHPTKAWRRRRWRRTSLSSNAAMAGSSRRLSHQPRRNGNSIWPISPAGTGVVVPKCCGRRSCGM